MELHDYFPWTAWLLRQLVSRGMLRIYFAVILLFCVANFWFRISSYLTARQYLRITHSLSTLTLDKSAKADVLRLVPTAVAEDGHGTSAANLEMWAAEYSNWNGWFIRMMGNPLGQQLRLHAVAYFFGYRAIRYRAEFGFGDGVLKKYAYSIWIDDGSLGMPGVVMAGAGVQSIPLEQARDRDSARETENPDYLIVEYFKWPDQNLYVRATSTAPAELRSHGFDLHLDCLVSLSGCKLARQILPAAWKDAREIEARRDHN